MRDKVDVSEVEAVMAFADKDVFGVGDVVGVAGIGNNMEVDKTWSSCC
jgi:hypothetical protein